MLPVVAYLAVALIMNLPFGMVRARMRKLSVSWFVAIHAPIPAVIALRLALDVSPWLIPAGIASAVVGQVIGGRLLAPSRWKAIGERKHAERAAGKAAPATSAEMA